MKILSPAAVSVTATPQRVALPENAARYTLRNTDTTYVVGFWSSHQDTDHQTADLAGASETALRALGASIVYTGEEVVIGPDVAYIDVVCITGGTATLYVDCCEVVSGLDTDLAALVTAVGLTNTSIGPTTAAASTAGGVGAVNAHLRRLTTDLAAQSLKIPALGTAGMTASSPVTVATDDTVLVASRTAAQQLQYLTRGKMTLASGQAMTCTADATDYTLTVVDAAVYRITADNGRIFLGEADSTSAANRILTIPAGCWDYYTAQSTTLHYSTNSGAGITGTLARVTMT